MKRRIILDYQNNFNSANKQHDKYFLIFELVKMFSAGQLDASQDDRKKMTQIDIVR